MSDSKTPRTDEEPVYQCFASIQIPYVKQSFARQLETELNEATNGLSRLASQAIELDYRLNEALDAIEELQPNSNEKGYDILKKHGRIRNEDH